MSDVTTDSPRPETKFDAEAFAMNVARAMESGGQALAAYLKPRETGEVQGQAAGRNRRGHQDLHLGRRILAVGQGPRRRTADQDRPRPISISGARRCAAWPARRRRPRSSPRRATSAFSDPEWKSNQFFDFVMQLYLLTTQWAQELVRNAEGLDPHTRKKAEFYVQQITNAISPSNFVLTNPEVLRETLASQRRQSRARHEDAGRGHRGRPRHAAHPPVRPGQSRGRRQHGDDAGQGDLPERADAADPVHADHGERAAHAAADRAALDQQVLHPRSQAGEILHQMVRRPGHHRVRDLLGQSGQGARQEDLRRLHEGRPARRDGRHREGDRRDEGAHRRLLRRRHPARLDAGLARREAPRSA